MTASQAPIPMHGDFADNLADGWELYGCPSMSRQDSGIPLSMSGFLTPPIPTASPDPSILFHRVSALLNKIEAKCAMDQCVNGTDVSETSCEKDSDPPTSDSVSQDDSSCVQNISERMGSIRLSEVGASAAPDHESSADAEMETSDISNFSTHSFIQETMTRPTPAGKEAAIVTVTKAKKSVCVKARDKSAIVPRKSQRLQDRANNGLAPKLFKRRPLR